MTVLCFFLVFFFQNLDIIPVQYLVPSLYIRHVRDQEWGIVDTVYLITDYKNHQIDIRDPDFELAVIKIRLPIGKKGNV